MKAIFGSTGTNDYQVRVAKTLDEAGFEYVTDMDGYKLFRKRK